METATKTAAKPKKTAKHNLKGKKLPKVNSKGEKLTKTGRAFGILKGKIIINPNCF